MIRPRYTRGLLKISGEALSGTRGYGIDKNAVSRIAGEIALAHREGHELGIVVGGGNILRGADAEAVGVPSLIGDHMGMIATVLNAMALKWALRGLSVPAEAMSAFNVGKFIDPFDLDHARELIRSKTVVIFAGGTGNPCFTTDSAAALRAVEIEADVMLKATQAPGVFDKDPNMYPDAKFFETIDVHEVIERRLGVLDAASVEILGRMRIPIIVLDLHVPGNIAAGLAGRRVGTLIVG